MVRHGTRIDNFWANEPERVNEWKTDKFLPLFAEIPEMKFARVFLAKPDGLIADEKLRVLGCRQAADNDRLAACAPRNARFQTCLYSKFCEQTAQEIDRGVRC